MRVNMLRVPVFTVGAVGYYEIRLNSLNIFADRLGKILQPDIYATRDSVDFHMGVDKRKEENIANAESACSVSSIRLGLSS